MNQLAEEFTIPPQSQRVSKHTKELSGLAVGDYYLAKGVTLEYACTMAWRQGKKLQRRFRCRTEEKGIRIYRTL